MVKLYAVVVLYKTSYDVRILKGAYDLQSFGFFERSSVQEFMSFTSKIVTERSSVSSRQSVKEQVCVSCVCTSRYLAGVVLDDFSVKVPAHLWASTEASAIPYNDLPATLAKWQNPREADALTRVQEEHNTIESILERGEKLDDLVVKSEMLTMQSKAFYKTARKTNACCNFG
ncbi:Synaptobrevin-like protein YKT6 [Armadillidium nasatum]|uniref:Synaptobrevin-like protein YKT6 n=1 Tax=Armadillidium nasatum TaxID=96803 RepID=A0A5N5TLB6_9CRUS|nr:Synaptobrevin-like protein YKT6 [Armadillidium nasatum]